MDAYASYGLSADFETACASTIRLLETVRHSRALPHVHDVVENALQDIRVALDHMRDLSAGSLVERTEAATRKYFKHSDGLHQFLSSASGAPHLTYSATVAIRDLALLFRRIHRSARVLRSSAGVAEAAVQDAGELALLLREGDPEIRRQIKDGLKQVDFTPLISRGALANAEWERMIQCSGMPASPPMPLPYFGQIREETAK